MFTVFLRVVGSVQIILGLAYLGAPGMVLASLGHSTVAPDLYYPLGMLAARFLAYGAGFWIISRQAAQHRLWIGLMGLIQAIDLAVGLLYTAAGVVPWQLSAFPMFNATWIGATCLVWAQRQRAAQGMARAA